MPDIDGRPVVVEYEPDSELRHFYKPPKMSPLEEIKADLLKLQGVAPTKLSLPDVVHRLKTMTTRRCVDGVKHNGWRPFPGKLWQRNYWEHIVRKESESTCIREYI